MRKVLMATAAMILLTPAHAATITPYQADSQGYTLLEIDGLIAEGDEKLFDNAMAAYKDLRKVTVRLSSNGGKFFPAMRIAEKVASAGMATYVPEGATCASSCAVIWISGSPRTINNQGHVGFHQIYDTNTRQGMPVPNAVLGAYLTRIGLDYKAVIWITEKDADGINWLTPEAAVENGITVDPIDMLPKVQMAHNDPLPPPIPEVPNRGTPVDPYVPPVQNDPPPPVAPSVQEACATVVSNENDGVWNWVLNMRTGPGTGYPVVNQLSPGSVVFISGSVDSSGKWQHISLNPGDGWVFAKYLQPVTCMPSQQASAPPAPPPLPPPAPPPARPRVAYAPAAPVLPCLFLCFQAPPAQYRPPQYAPPRNAYGSAGNAPHWHR
jgi:hypothetical protein